MYKITAIENSTLHRHISVYDTLAEFKAALKEWGIYYNGQTDVRFIFG